MLKLANAFLAAIVATALTVPAFAQQPAPQNVRVRGTVEALNGDTLTVVSRDGQKLDIKMQPN